MRFKVIVTPDCWVCFYFNQFGAKWRIVHLTACPELVQSTILYAHFLTRNGGVGVINISRFVLWQRVWQIRTAHIQTSYKSLVSLLSSWQRCKLGWQRTLSEKLIPFTKWLLLHVIICLRKRKYLSSLYAAYSHNLATQSSEQLSDVLIQLSCIYIHTYIHSYSSSFPVNCMYISHMWHRYTNGGILAS